MNDLLIVMQNVYTGKNIKTNLLPSCRRRVGYSMYTVFLFLSFVVAAFITLVKVSIWYDLFSESCRNVGCLGVRRAGKSALVGEVDVVHVGGDRY